MVGEPADRSDLRCAPGDGGATGEVEDGDVEWPAPECRGGGTILAVEADRGVGVGLEVGEPL